MVSCLGLYVEDNIIKYAKVSKSNDAIKVESFGIKFYEDLNDTIKQIIQETYSHKISVSINMSDEIYNKFEVFSLLKKSDMIKAIKTEFENICYDEEMNPEAYEQRHLIISPNSQNEKAKIIHICVPKTSIAQKKNQFSHCKVSSMLPMGIAIANLVKKEKKTTELIVNIEKTTTITKVHNNQVIDVNVISVGAQEIIDSISKRENSYSKAYEICKNTTIYTENDKDIEYQDNEYLIDVMPVLYQIATEVRNITQDSVEEIEKVYITGTASVINNIDIYFQEYLGNISCEVLKPSFIGNNSKINIKDYIEVNSAIALALNDIEKNNEANFTKAALMKKSNASENKGIEAFFDKYNRFFKIGVFVLSLLLILYLVGLSIINKQLDTKITEAEMSINNTNAKIAQIEEYNKNFNQRITDYQRLIKDIEDINNVNSEKRRYRNTIPNLLNNIMAVIPKGVQLTSIQNTSEVRIVINARTNQYDQIAFFKAKLKTEKILQNVISNAGTMQDGYLNVTIEGDLP